jgi:hypothetical protein
VPQKIIRTRRGMLVAAASIAVLVIAAGVAYGMIPDASGVIHSCYTTSNGALRVIDTDAGGACKKGETSLNWNQTGPQGSTGPQGPAGQNGTADAFGLIGPDGTVSPASKNVSQANVTHRQTGVYCIGGLVVNGQPYFQKIAIGNGLAGITTDGNGNIIPSPGSDAIIETLPLGDLPNVTLALCPDTAKVRVYTYSASDHALADRGFQILFDN